MTLATFGLTTAGEFSVAVNDCGRCVSTSLQSANKSDPVPICRFLNGVNLGVRFEGTYPHSRNPVFSAVGSCEKWDVS